jgi:hypothetical protein
MIKVEISLDGPRFIEAETPVGWESWSAQGKEVYIRAMQLMLIDSTVDFIVSDGQGEDM